MPYQTPVHWSKLNGMGSRFLRFLVVLWAVTSATLPGVLSITHAADAAAAATPVPSHVEPEGSEGCPPAHADCALCSWHRWTGAEPGTQAPMGLEARGGVGAPAGRRSWALPAGDRLVAQPRAPPRA